MTRRTTSARRKPEARSSVGEPLLDSGTLIPRASWPRAARRQPATFLSLPPYPLAALGSEDGVTRSTPACFLAADRQCRRLSTTLKRTTPKTCRGPDHVGRREGRAPFPAGRAGHADTAGELPVPCECRHTASNRSQSVYREVGFASSASHVCDTSHIIVRLGRGCGSGHWRVWTASKCAIYKRFIQKRHFSPPILSPAPRKKNTTLNEGRQFG